MIGLLKFYSFLLLIIVPLFVKLYFFQAILENLDVDCSYFWIFVSIVFAEIAGTITAFVIIFGLSFLGALSGNSLIFTGGYLLGVGAGLYVYFHVLGWLLNTSTYIIIVADVVSNIYTIIALGVLLLIISMLIPTGHDSQYLGTLNQKLPWG